MKVILVSDNKNGSSRSFSVSVWTGTFLTVCLACLIGVPVGFSLTFAGGEADGQERLLDPQVRSIWARQLFDQQRDVDETRERADHKLSALTMRVSDLQARLVRLDALGERLTEVAQLDNGEFDFSRPPAIGGPELDMVVDGFAPPDINSVIDDLSQQIESRQNQLETLEELLTNSKLDGEAFIAGRPVDNGWISSRFGRRTDPFSGRVAWHTGIDFSGKEGTDIVSVATGVVTWSSERTGYGNLVEINHGNGFKTRYAHCKENLVKVGDVVKKGQIVALMGSSGRSTGSHVHFEVYKHGRPVDPASYIHRVSR